MSNLNKSKYTLVSSFYFGESPSEFINYSFDFIKKPSKYSNSIGNIRVEFAILLNISMQNKLSVLTKTRCQFCGERIYFVHEMSNVNDDLYLNCEKEEITLDQYNAGVLNPICYKCDKILTAFNEGDYAFTNLMKEYEYQTFLRDKVAFRKILRFLYIPDPEIPYYLFHQKKGELI